jgi:hypothetical protein
MVGLGRYAPRRERTVTESEKLADFYLRKFHERRLEDLPETSPPLSGEMNQTDWVLRMEAVIDKLDEIRFEHAAR